MSTDSVDVNRYISVLAGVIGAEPDIVYVPDEMLDEIAAPGSPPAYSHLFGTRHHAALDVGKAVRMLGEPRSTCARAMSTPTSGAAIEGSTRSRMRSSIPSGRRRGTSISRPRSQDGSVADVEPQGLTDREILRSVEDTVLRVLLPSLRDDAGWARAVAIQLAGLARYAARRPADATAERVEEITAVLGGMTGNEIVAGVWNGATPNAS